MPSEVTGQIYTVSWGRSFLADWFLGLAWPLDLGLNIYSGSHFPKAILPGTSHLDHPLHHTETNWKHLPLHPGPVPTIQTQAESWNSVYQDGKTDNKLKEDRGHVI